MRPLLLAFGALLLLSVVSTGCSAPEVPDPVPLPTVEAAAPAPPQSPPTWVRIPKIGVESTLVPVGLTADGEIDVSQLATLQAAYYAGKDPERIGDEALPGEPGVPAAIVGHVDGPIDGVKGRPGVFARLNELAPGDEIWVEREDGSRLRFLVQRVERHPKAAFPTEDVYAPTPGPELRLITCGGAFDRSSRHYVDNWIVWAHLS